MAFERRQFEEVTRAEAEAIGVPGQRRFRMIFADQYETAVLWLEKQQLQALGLAFEQIIGQLRSAGVAEARAAAPRPGPVGPVPPDAWEIQVGRLMVGFDEDRNLVSLFIHDIEADEDDPPSFVCRMNLAQIGTMAIQIGEVVAAGRPLCPRCHQPIDPGGHVCPHDNGHFPHLIRPID
ncbi:MAG: DUF3090 domain-containing protein [Chloroflexi bacterium]|nr:MAG: DUF3090 domain-containing protein [Chloroflexota bacterium]